VAASQLLCPTPFQEDARGARWWHQLGLGVVLFVLTYGPKFFGRLDLIAVASLSLVAYHGWRRRPLAAPITQLAVLLVGLLGYSLGVTVLGSSCDLFFAARAARALVNFLGAYVLVDLYARAFGRAATWSVLRAIFWVIAAHALIMLVMFAYPGLGERIYAVTLSEEPQAKIVVGWRTAGLTEGLGTTSVPQSLGLLLAPFMVAAHRRLAGKVTYLGGMLAILGSVVLSGRTGLLLALLFVPVAALLAGIHPPRLPSQAGRTPLTAVALVVVLTVAWFGARALPEEARQRLALITLPHALEGFFSWVETGEFRIQSAEDVLEDQFILPDAPLVLLFGTGQSGRGSSVYVPSDVGYVRFVFGLGLVGSLIAYAFYVFSLLYAVRARRAEPWLAWITGLALAAVLVAHTKTILVLTRNAFTITSVLVACCVAEVALRAPAPGSRRVVTPEDRRSTAASHDE
jgi:hypothetical protein